VETAAPLRRNQPPSTFGKAATALGIHTSTPISHINRAPRLASKGAALLVDGADRVRQWLSATIITVA
jgi:hypothetical protein